eukprot:gnl/TRDRNA2_/TRDRNA2_76557_c0_seq1.p1 gnl/TRDRNA2_/TRDRNA2_76557_c0~~gnl/TRDRNA2_/TRDRNA2_76557_c0_seq1.p1  ORF type:complete len:332 (-),score=63.50 gnl/TRDRNA2_/TRDRNA2_76557_c0_seq1:29-1003(-)
MGEDVPAEGKLTCFFNTLRFGKEQCVVDGQVEELAACTEAGPSMWEEVTAEAAEARHAQNAGEEFERRADEQEDKAADLEAPQLGGECPNAEAVDGVQTAAADSQQAQRDDDEESLAPAKKLARIGMPESWRAVGVSTAAERPSEPAIDPPSLSCSRGADVRSGNWHTSAAQQKPSSPPLRHPGASPAPARRQLEHLRAPAACAPVVPGLAKPALAAPAQPEAFARPVEAPLKLSSRAMSATTSAQSGRGPSFVQPSASSPPRRHPGASPPPCESSSIPITEHPRLSAIQWYRAPYQPPKTPAAQQSEVFCTPRRPSSTMSERP